MREDRQAQNHFRVIYDVFLRRIIDLDLLSADADTSKLLAQVAALFAGVSFLFTAPLILFTGLPPDALRTMQHLLIATSIMVIGILSLLAWESVFPERLDLLVLGPLPVPTQTLFFAKLTALLGAEGLSLLALNSFTGLVWPFLFVPYGDGWGGDLRSLVAYWVAIFAAAIFTFSTSLAFQGLLSLTLPRQLFLRSAVWVQTLGFAALVALFILEPSLETPEALSSTTNQRLLSALPSYWFFGLFQQFNKSVFPGTAPLAKRAWIGLAVSFSVASLTVVMGYLRMLRRIVEQPDIGPASSFLSRILQSQIGTSGAILLFSTLTMARSRKHRVLLAFYWGAGAAIVCAMTNPFFTKMANAQEVGPTETYVTASLLLVCLGPGALRTLINLPVAARADWLFRMTEFDKVSVYRRASNRFVVWLGLVPAWLVLSIISLARWPGWRAFAFASILGIFGLLVAKICTVGLRKIPFACSYQPGKGNVHLIFWSAVFLLFPVSRLAAKGLQRSLGAPVSAICLGLILLGALLYLNRSLPNEAVDERGLLFEEEPLDDLLSLRLL
jgi:hypothetical protein